MATSFFLLAACSGFEQLESQIDNPSSGDTVERVIFEVLPFKDADDPETKASAVPNTTGTNVAFQWEVTDTVGIYPNTGSQVYFTMENGAGTSSADFNGGGWALKQNSTYVSYYPFVGDIYLKRNKVPVSFDGQKQIGTTPPFNGARYFLASDASSSNNGVLRFTYSTLNTIINIKATLPAGTYTKATLTVDEPLFVEEGTFSLDNKTIVGSKYSRTLAIDLEDFTLTSQAQVPVYIMSAPIDLSSKEVTVRFYASDGKKYKCVKNTIQTAFNAGTRYGLVCAMEEYNNPNELIIYTSADGKIVTPNNADVFGANILFNEYKNGSGTIEFDGNVTSIGENAFGDVFLGRGRLTSIIIPSSVTTIGEQAFYYCSRLSGNLTLPEGLTTIEYAAFEGCSGFTGELTLPSTLSTIGHYAFHGCSGFTGDLTVPEGVLEIGKYAFAYCGGLSGALTLPSSLTAIGTYAFYSCRKLSSIMVFAETPPSLGSTAFDNTNNCPIYVPAGTVDAYKNANGWSNYADRIFSMEGGEVPGSGDGGDV